MEHLSTSLGPILGTGGGDTPGQFNMNPYIWSIHLAIVFAASYLLVCTCLGSLNSGIRWGPFTYLQGV
jgi:hypothetical protein